jgi:hypothetical protein
MPSRFLPRHLRTALIGLALALCGLADPASAMCGGNIFMKCSSVAKAAGGSAIRPRAAKPRRKTSMGR